MGIPLTSNRKDERLQIKTLKKSFFLNPTQRNQFLVNIEKHAEYDLEFNSQDYLLLFLEIAEKKEISSINDLIEADILLLATINSTWVNGMTRELYASQGC